MILLCGNKSKLSAFSFSKKELTFIKKQQQAKKEIIELNQYERKVIIVNPKKEKNSNQHIENCRMLGDQLQARLKDEQSVMIIDVKKSQNESLAIAEGMALANYTFTKHKTKAEPNKLKTSICVSIQIKNQLQNCKTSLMRYT